MVKLLFPVDTEKCASHWPQLWSSIQHFITCLFLQINSKFLNSPVTGDSTGVTSFNSSCGSFFQTPTTSKNGKKSNGKMQIGILSKAPCNIGAGLTPRSALLARFAGDETDGRGWMVNTPTTAGKEGDLGVNLGLAVTPGELLERRLVHFMK